MISLAGVGISFIDRKVREISYATIKSLTLICKDSDRHYDYSFSVGWIQVDNQIYGCLKPILFYPTIITQTDSNEDNPVVMFALQKSKDSSYGLDHYPWLMLLLQEISIDVDEEFLYAALDFFSFKTSKSNDLLYSKTMEVEFPGSVDNSDFLYFEKLLLQPIQLNLSFSRTQESHTDRSKMRSSSVMTLIYDVLTMTIGSVTDAPIRLKALSLENPIMSSSKLQDRISSFYYQETLGQVHNIIGAADFFGNPVKLFSTVASGVTDMFYEPLQGFQITRPQDFGIGVAKGASSLVRKTVFGLSDTFSKVAGSIGKGVAVMTLDAKYQETRRRDSRNRPEHVVDGVASGAVSLFKGVTSGVSGIIEQPFKGAQESGVGGFFAGLGKGLVGAVTKPVVGIVDMATNITDGIKGSTNNDKVLQRQRLPRFIPNNGLLIVVFSN
jgi:vacuolar protein sorting-associated protein 13A/C